MPEQLALLNAPPREAPLQIHGDAEISDRFRWWLRRWWAAGPCVCWVMLNPSTADATKDDPTLKRIIGFTHRWGYAGLIVVNLYPYRSPSPAECRRWADYEKNGPDWHARDQLWRNIDVVKAKTREADLVIAAWGAGAWDLPYVDHVCEEITNGEEPWPSLHCIGVTDSGAPKHPLARGKHRVADDQRPIRWPLAT